MQKSFSFNLEPLTFQIIYYFTSVKIIVLSWETFIVDLTFQRRNDGKACILHKSGNPSLRKLHDFRKLG